MNFGDSTNPLTFNLAQSFTRVVRRFDFVAIGFRFVLLGLYLCGNSIHTQFREEYAKLIKAEQSERSNESPYYPCSLRINTRGLLFHILFRTFRTADSFFAQSSLYNEIRAIVH